MKFRLYVCLKYEKGIRSIIKLTRYINVCKILNFLLYCHLSNPEPALDYNTTYLLDLLSDNHKEDISLRRSNNSKKEIKLADMDSNEKDIRSVDIDKQMLATLN